MKHVRLLTTALFLLCITLIGSAASSSKGEYIGYISYIKGSVYITANGKTFRARNKIRLYTGYYVRTLSGAYVSVKLGNGSYMRLKQNTRITLNTSHVKTASALSVGVTSGAVTAKINPAKKKKVKIYSPSTIVAIKGTEFTVALGLDGSTMVSCDRGKVNLKVNADEEMLFLEDDAENEIDITERKAGVVYFGEEEYGVVSKEGIAEPDTDTFRKERENIAMENPMRTMMRMRERMELVQGQNLDILMETKSGTLGDEELERLDEQLHATLAVTRGIADLAGQVYTLSDREKEFDRLVLKAEYDLIMKIQKAEEELNAKIEAVLAEME